MAEHQILAPKDNAEEIQPRIPSQHDNRSEPSMKTASAYQYKPLAGPSIRLLKLNLSPSTKKMYKRRRMKYYEVLIDEYFAEPIEEQWSEYIEGNSYELIETLLDDAPPYEVISYLWGDQVKSELFYLSSGDFIHITPTLQATLACLFPHCETGYLWADQLCIDQTSITERNHQVALMGQIYSKSQRGLIYFSGYKSYIERYPFRFASMPRSLNGYLADGILTQPWFGRGWVIQEAILPASVVCFFGPFKIPLDILWVEVSLYYGIRHKQFGPDPIASPQLDCYHITFSKSGSFGSPLGGYQGTRWHNELLGTRFLAQYEVLREIMRMRQKRHAVPADTAYETNCFFQSLSTLASVCKTSNNHDRIFAYLGLLEDTRIEFQPDYDINWNTLPLMITRAIIEGTSSLDIFGILHRFKDIPSQWPGLPSWVPDWLRRQCCGSMLPADNQMYFNSAAGRPYRSGRTASSHLLIRGKIIDEVWHREVLRPYVNNGSRLGGIGWVDNDTSESFLNIGLLMRWLNRIWYYLDADDLTLERLLVAVLADGMSMYYEESFDFNNPGLSAEDIQGLLEIYYIPYATVNGVHSRKAVGMPDPKHIDWQRVLIAGNKGRLGLAHESVCEGDLICIIHGSRVPLILRPLENGKYQMMGQCYYEGAMRGEEVTWDEADADEFVLV